MNSYIEDNSEYFTYSVYDINKLHQEKQEKRIGIYKRITSNCFKKIKLAVDNEELYILYKIPEFIPGTPLFNMTECVMFILNELKDRGFSSRYVHPFVIFVSWNVSKPVLRTSKPEPQKKSVLDTIGLKVKTIDSYKPSGNYFFKK